MNRTTTLLAASAFALLALAPSAAALGPVGQVGIKISTEAARQLLDEVPPVNPGPVLELVGDLAPDTVPECVNPNNSVQKIASDCVIYAIGLIGPTQEWATTYGQSVGSWALGYAAYLQTYPAAMQAYVAAVSAFGGEVRAYTGTTVGMYQAYAANEILAPGLAYGSNVALLGSAYATAWLQETNAFVSDSSENAVAWASAYSQVFIPYVHGLSTQALADAMALFDWVTCTALNDGANCGLVPPVPTVPNTGEIPDPGTPTLGETPFVDPPIVPDPPSPGFPGTPGPAPDAPFPPPDPLPQQEFPRPPPPPL